jgi:DNA-binding response OmpR family regulator
MSANPVLLVSGSEIHAASANRALLREGYLVRRASDPSTAIMMLLGGNYQAVVLDRNLPGDGAAELLQKLAANFDMLDVPVILIGAEESLARDAWARRARPNRAVNVLQALSKVCGAFMV